MRKYSSSERGEGEEREEREGGGRKEREGKEGVCIIADHIEFLDDERTHFLANKNFAREECDH